MSSAAPSPSAAELLEFLLDAAATMVGIGAETYRIEESIERMAMSLGAERTEVFVTPPGVFIQITVGGVSATGIRRVKLRSFNLAPLAELNALSRATANGLSLAEARERLIRIQTAPRARPWLLDLAAGALGAMSFALLLGGGSVALTFSLGLGVAIGILRRTLRRRFVDRFIASFLGGVLCALFGRIGHSLGSGTDTIAAAGLVILVPGLQFTSAIRDILAGDLLSAAAQGLEVATLALGLAGGVAAGLALPR